ncbi:MAG: tripartite tricarboxylate transporter substrate binding protein [Lawsonibacter sp.]|nr:tripartite tricarboxylate transporter substrate binding protein [Lawsonibacter sp.]
MKKLLTALLATAMLLGLASCSKPAEPSGTSASNPPTGSQSTGQSEPTPAPTTNYPTGPITMIIPYGAGGTSDLAGRQLAIALEKQLGQSIIVSNQAGASGTVGIQAALDADPDGYTMVLAAESLGTCRVMGISEMSYDDFSPISAISSDPKVLVVASNSKYETLQDLLDEIQANPGKVQMSYTGPGGSGHIQALIMNRYGFEPALTAYSSGAEGITAVLGNQVQFTNSNYSTVVPYLESGDLRLLAVCATKRMEAYPDVPALSEFMEGSDDLLSLPYSPLTLLVNKDVPADVQEVLRSATKAACADPDFNAWLDSNCIDKLFELYPTVEDTKAFFTEWESTVSWMLHDAGATINSPEDYNIAKP